MKSLLIQLCAFIFLGTLSCKENAPDKVPTPAEGIQPWSENPYYWTYKGQPVLLLGATDDDNLFQLPNLKSHLDSLHAIGGNYVRNTMSDRDEGNQRAFAQNEVGKYDLNQWNSVYWARLDSLLQWSSERDIVVQIEIWDRFDHSRDEWLTDPFNPGNNINYTYEETQLDSLYPNHPGANEQPFFFTVPALNNNEVLLKYQQAFVRKLMTHALPFDNVLYCIDNETKGVNEWAVYWNEFIHDLAGEKKIMTTQMWDDWDIKSSMHKRTLDHPERYQFVDMSQNSHNTGQLNWDNAQHIFTYIKASPRPVNSTKIYGSATSPWRNRGIDEIHSVQTFFRNILGGFASSRFHRPPAGLGLSPLSINAIRSLRMAEQRLKLWDLNPMMDRLSNREENEAYLAGKEGEQYLLYFPNEGDVVLDLSSQMGNFELHWINTTTASWLESEEISGGALVQIKTPVSTGSLVLLIKK
jgi:hypothetical protein